MNSPGVISNSEGSLMGGVSPIPGQRKCWRMIFLPPPLPSHCHAVSERASSLLSSWQDGCSLLLVEETLKVFVWKQWLFVLGDSIVISKVHLGLPPLPPIGAALSQDKAGSGHHGAGEEGRDPWPLVTCIYTPTNINWMFFIRYWL